MPWPLLRSVPYRLLRRFPLPPWLHWRLARVVNDRFLLGVIGIVHDDQQRVLVFHHTYKQVPWGLPAGWMRHGESPLDGLGREVREESGLLVEATRLLLVGTIGDRPKLDFVVGGRVVGGSFRPSGEVDGFAWWSHEQLGDLAASQRHLIALAAELNPGEVGWYTASWGAEIRSEYAW